MPATRRHLVVSFTEKYGSILWTLLLVALIVAAGFYSIMMISGTGDPHAGMDPLLAAELHRCSVIQAIISCIVLGLALVGLIAQRRRQRGLQRNLAEIEQTEEELRQSREQLRHLAVELSTIEQRERRRIAAYLHDEIGQTLGAVQLHVLALSKDPDAASIGATLKSGSALLSKATEDIRALTFELSPPILFDLGLGAAVEAYGERMAAEHGLQFVLNDEDWHGSVKNGTAELLFRSTRELIFNSVKHASASRVTVSLVSGPDDLLVTVEDDGVGFDPAITPPPVGERGFGILSIRERMEFFGGRLVIESRKGEGTRSTLVLPVGSGDDPGMRDNP